MIIERSLSQEGGAEAAAQFLKLSPRPDGLFSSNDLAAAGAMQVIKAHGLRVPQDVAVAGFSNEVFTTLTDPPPDHRGPGLRNDGHLGRAPAPENAQPRPAAPHPAPERDSAPQTAGPRVVVAERLSGRGGPTTFGRQMKSSDHLRPTPSKTPLPPNSATSGAAGTSAPAGRLRPEF